MLVSEEQLCKFDSDAMKEKMKENNNIELQQRLANSVSYLPHQ